jgi:hypothetical protein
MDFDNTHTSSKCVHSRHIWKPAEDRTGKPLEKPGQNLANPLLVTHKTNKPHQRWLTHPEFVRTASESAVTCN